jgi:hypothetical protein
LLGDQALLRRRRAAVSGLIADTGLAERPAQIDAARRLDAQDRRQRLLSRDEEGLRTDQDVADLSLGPVDQALPGRLAVARGLAKA